jgi:hypothetical protein
MKIMGSVGVSMILLGEALSFVHILPWSQFVFPLFWYGYILVVDALNQRLHGRSLLAERKREFAVMLPVSALYWYLFEWYNLVIDNWFYINTPPQEWLAVSMKIISFATVIPALCETAELLESLVGGARAIPAQPPVAEKWRGASFIAGFVLAALPLLFPRFFFWSVWLGLFFLIDPLNDRMGRPSIVRDWLEGRWRRTIAWLGAGYICGFFWEFWNYWAYTKWVYTIPLPEMPHVFEMPALGFLGFGPFALETFAFWTLIWGSAFPNPSTVHRSPG